jgi:lipid-binding SYLF domain-containing protein
MKVSNILAVGAAVAVLLGSASALAQNDKAKKQAEIRKEAQVSLQEFFKKSPELKGKVAKAPGYAVFSTFGLSFIVGGAGGKGIVVDNKTKKVTYMELAQATAGAQIGAAESRFLFVFRDAASMKKFIDSGWEAGAGVSAGAGTGEKAASAGTHAMTGAEFYSLTKAGFQAGAVGGGLKVWKDKDLN